MRALHGESDAALDDYVCDVQLHACMVMPAEPLGPPIVTNDPDDDAVVAAELAG